MPHTFLHNHPGLEHRLEQDIYSNHVIVDKEDWLKAIDLHKEVVDLLKKTTDEMFVAKDIFKSLEVFKEILK